MNTDSKLNRYIILLQKAPFILFIESCANTIMHPRLNGLGVVEGDYFRSVKINEDHSLRHVIATINGLPDPLAYNIIEALANALPNNAMYFPVHFFTANDWQNYIEWQNVDTKPEPTVHEYTVTVDRITHELNTIYSKDLESSTKAYDGTINLSSVNISVPFPKALLKECVADVYEIIKVMSMNREPATIAKSKYMSVMNTGYETFNWCNLKKIEKDLTAVIRANNITIEQ